MAKNLKRRNKSRKVVPQELNAGVRCDLAFTAFFTVLLRVEALSGSKTLSTDLAYLLAAIVAPADSPFARVDLPEQCQLCRILTDVFKPDHAIWKFIVRA